MDKDSREKTIRRFLLGELPEAEQLALSENLFTDDETFERIWAVENDLVDRYVRGQLTLAEMTLFETHYLASPIHRERVAFAKALIENADAKEARTRLVTERASPWWASFTATARRTPLRWVTAAAMLLLIACAVWLVAERVRLREQVGRLQSEKAEEDRRTAETEKQIAAERERRDQLAAEIERQRDGQSPQVTGQTPAQSPSVRDEHSSVITFLLSPMLMRGGGEPTRLKVTRETRRVVLQMKVEGSKARSFQISLRTVEGSQVWSQSGIKAGAKGRNGFVISAGIPGDKLPTGDYILTLSVADGTNQLTEVNRYFFSVLRP